MKKHFFIVFAIFFVVSFYAQQEVCESPDESPIDVNSITKCTIEPLKNSKKKSDRQIKVKVSASKRFLKRRKAAKKRVAQNVESVKAVKVGQLANVSGTDKIIQNHNPKNKIVTLKSSIDVIKERLSKEEIAKASKLYYVDRIPSFKNCRKAKKGDRLDCFNTEMVNHINKYFRYPSEAIRNQIVGEVWVRFIIDKNGYVTNIKTLGPDNGEILNDEAKRVVSKLPQFKPAKNEGELVSVKYGFPINFSLEE